MYKQFKIKHAVYFQIYILNFGVQNQKPQQMFQDITHWVLNLGFSL